MKPAALVPVVLERLREKYPDAKYELNWNTPFQLLVATILAAQCTDERVNRVTAELWKKYDGPQALADADTAELEEDLKPTGFFKQKTKTVQAVSRALLDAHGGEVPDRMEDLVELPGVARKTANVVLNTAFNQASGVIVDTHVARVSQRLGLTKQEKPEAIETDLMKLVPKDDWTFFGPAVVLHGRYTCVAKKPKCAECLFNDVCPKLGVA
ncbi:endonuclease III [Corallococcus coralloides DSM 2259]|uniref:Endonuclease III n=1 Tax=Corallococcus coralloides (strain ATCC 25202 / DSM 2259 / NBRC 100086 / M2) TaxID=1144275 RepID=H8MVG3_CORCM|nr:endonuclease III [Corallococcus coralloides]AFE09644.1 endonuclease III [Corallococcus coralloides DSM 2259]